MKIAYRIVTPILAVAGIVMGFFLKMFSFTIGNADDQINNLISAVSSLTSGKFSTLYEYSLFDIVKMAVQAEPKTGEDAKSLTEIAGAVLPLVYAFIVLFVLIVLVLIAIAIVGALSNSKKKRTAEIFLCAGGLVLSLACIFVSNAAFEKIINGDVNLTDVISYFSSNALVALATAVISITEASLSAGFYAIFGIFMVIIMWTIAANMVIKTPIVAEKTYKRKKPARSIKYLVRKK